MEFPNELKNEITVRITTGFQDAPDVYALLAMTAVRDRRKLIFQALKNYIKQTSHPAGEIPVQLEIVGHWLKARSGHDVDFDPINSSKAKVLSREKIGTTNRTVNETDVGNNLEINIPTKVTGNIILNSSLEQSDTVNRWLSIKD